MNNITSVIAAVSTPPGKGGVAVIRMSGDGAIDIARRVCYPRSKRTLESYPCGTQIYSDYILDGNTVDDCLVSFYRAPRSYTGEDTVEICAHGNMQLTKIILEGLFRYGAVPATAGEFTRRAFINGKLSLLDAEKIGNLLDATTVEQVKLASPKARTLLTDRILALRGELVSLLSSIYARIDYPDEDLGELSHAEILSSVRAIKNNLTRLISTYKAGHAISEGISTAIVGKTNVGKSTLYNMILGEDAAIVTDVEGTTRDILERTCSLGRLTVKLFDTAGMRDTEGIDRVEAIGIERAKSTLSKAELVLAVFDGSRELGDEDIALLNLLRGISSEKIAIISKCDLDARIDERKIKEEIPDVIHITSAEPESSLSSLTELAEQLFSVGKISINDDAVITSARQNASLRRALDALVAAERAYEIGVAEDAASSEIEIALSALGELDGRQVSDEVVADIFNRFCVGK